jgi:hypothetical protein
MSVATRALGLWLGISALLATGVTKATTIVNGSFESNLQGWIVEDIALPFVPLGVFPEGLSPGFGLFVSAPTDGTLAVLHGFDGGGPGLIRLSQDVAVSPAFDIKLKFDYRAGWDLATFCSQCSDRHFQIVVREAGGGGILASYPLLTATAGTFNGDSGNLVGSIDLSPFAGRDVRVSFEWLIPDYFSGPAFFQLDNLRVEEVVEAWLAFGTSRRQVPPTEFVSGGMGLRWDNIVGIIRPGDGIGAGAGKVVGASQPWVAGGGWAKLDLHGERLQFSVSGLNLASGNEIGTRGQVSEVKGTIICDTDGSASTSGDSVLVDTLPIPFDPNGDASYNDSISPMPAVCLTEPDVAFVLRNVIRAASGTAANHSPGLATSQGGLTILHTYAELPLAHQPALSPDGGPKRP